MSPLRRTASLTGWLFIVTFITAIPALLLFDPVLNDPGYTRCRRRPAMFLGAFLELVLIIANIGTALALFPILKRQNESLALGYVTARVMNASSSPSAS